MKTILCIDDDPQLQVLYQRILEEADFVVLTTGSGRNGLYLLEKHSVDLVMTDILMPDMDGIDIILKMRILPSPPPIIAISGGGSFRLKVDMLAVARVLGAKTTLSKPFTESELLEAVASVLGAG